MAAKPQNPTPVSRLSRFGIGLGLKAPSSSPRSRESEKNAADTDEDWYIPYNGPYEPRPLKPRERDSWGDPIGGEEEEEEDVTLLVDRDMRNRYGGDHHDPQHDQQHRNPPHVYSGVHEREGRTRNRSQSAVSGRTVSSGAVDPSRVSVGSTPTRRRSTHSHANASRHPVPSYLKLDAAGGVGGSPMPIQRSHSPITSPAPVTNLNNRLSLASFFTFGGQSKKVPPSPSFFPAEYSPDSPPLPKTPSRQGKSTSRATPDKGLSRAGSPDLRHSSSSEWNRNNPMTRLRRENPRLALKPTTEPRSSSVTTDEEDYYNSYYSTLITTPTSKSHPQYPHVNSANLPRGAQAQNSHYAPEESNSLPASSKPTPHPYAYVFPSPSVAQGPQSAPLSSSAQPKFNESNHVSDQQPPPRLTFTSPSKNTSTAHATHFEPSGLPRPEISRLKSSASTPDLRIARRSPPNANTKPILPRGIDRWLSAETWCDALLFPRPRFKFKGDGGTVYIGSGRIVSPPGSPILRDGANSNEGAWPQREQPEKGLESRVLAHSRSLADLHNGTSTPGAGPSSLSKREEPRARVMAAPSSGPTNSTTPIQEISNASRKPPRPKSFALDDLDLPSPAPSLARVLEEGRLLEDQRQQWRNQAKDSFQNSRARNLSRTRSKSLTYKRGKRKEPQGHKPQSSIDFLAARSLLGNQDLMPIMHPPGRNRTGSPSTHRSQSAGRPSHSHSSSLAKTISKSSRTHSRGHSRSDSWSKSAMRLAKSTVNLCGLNGDVSMTTLPLGDKASALEGALEGDSTRIIRLADPAEIPVDKSSIAPLSANPLSASPRNGLSPTPSGTSDSKVGIALSTPPPDDYDRESIRLHAHPYAQAGAYSYHPPMVEPEVKVSDYAGPHPSSAFVRVESPKAADVSARHRLPPQASWHPYAQVSAQDSYPSEDRIITHPRTDSNVPPPAKMWAPLSTGVVREVLPNEFQYSPFMVDRSPVSEDSSSSRGYARNSRTIYDTVGVGEALAYAVRGETDEFPPIQTGGPVHKQDSRDSGLGTSEDHAIIQAAHTNHRGIRTEDENLRASGHSAPSSHRKPVQYDASRPPYHHTSTRSSEPASNHTLASSPSDRVNPPDFRFTTLAGPGAVNHSYGSVPSPGVTSSSSSPQQSPRLLGSVDDLDHFHDLFFRPNLTRELSDEVTRPSLSRIPSVPWDVGSNRHRTGSGLTSLARQLSEEFEELNMQSEPSETSAQRQGRFGGRQGAEPNLHFVLSDASRTTSPTQTSDDLLLAPDEHRSILPFHPSVNIPEDIESSRASSLMEDRSQLDDDEDVTARFRLGIVEAVSTPPATSNDVRLSGHLSFVDHQSELPNDEYLDKGEDRARVTSGSSLQPPTSSDPTRTSYRTSSTGSRMSGLSDFPVPPLQDQMTPGNMSILTAYYDDITNHRETSPLNLTHRRRLTFGGDEEIDFAMALSSVP